MSKILQALLGHTSAMGSRTELNREANTGETRFLRFAITCVTTVYALYQERRNQLIKALADQVEDVEKVVDTIFGAFEDVLEGLSTTELHVSFPLNEVYKGVWVPNVGNPFVYIGASSPEEGGQKIGTLKPSAAFIDRVLQLPSAQEAADRMQEEDGITVNLEAKRLATMIRAAERSQQIDAQKKRGLRDEQGNWTGRRRGGFQNATPSVSRGQTPVAGFGSGSEAEDLPDVK